MHKVLGGLGGKEFELQG